MPIDRPPDPLSAEQCKDIVRAVPNSAANEMCILALQEAAHLYRVSERPKSGSAKEMRKRLRHVQSLIEQLKEPLMLVAEQRLLSPGSEGWLKFPSQAKLAEDFIQRAIYISSLAADAERSIKSPTGRRSKPLNACMFSLAVAFDAAVKKSPSYSTNPTTGRRESPFIDFIAAFLRQVDAHSPYLVPDTNTLGEYVAKWLKDFPTNVRSSGEKVVPPNP